MRKESAEMATREMKNTQTTRSSIHKLAIERPSGTQTDKLGIASRGPHKITKKTRLIQEIFGRRPVSKGIPATMRRV